MANPLPLISKKPTPLILPHIMRYTIISRKYLILGRVGGFILGERDFFTARHQPQISFEWQAGWELINSTANRMSTNHYRYWVAVKEHNSSCCIGNRMNYYIYIYTHYCNLI